MLQLLLKNITIEGLNLSNRLFLAPLAGYTDHGFRKEIGKISDIGMTMTELISAKGIVYRQKETLSFLENLDKEPCPVCVQLFSGEPEVIRDAIDYICEYYPAVYSININMGCPVKKVLKIRAGAALMEDEKRATRMMKFAVAVSKVPISIKMRTGLVRKDRLCVRYTLLAEDNGIKLVFIHGRSLSQKFSGEIDFDSIKRAKEVSNIFVIGNGNILDLKSAEEFLRRTLVDGLMIGRGALFNPWIFKEILQEKEISEEKKMLLRLKFALNLLKCYIELYGEKIGIKRMRKFYKFFTSGLSFSRKLRVVLIKAETFEEVKNLLFTYIERSDR